MCGHGPSLSASTGQAGLSTLSPRGQAILDHEGGGRDRLLDDDGMGGSEEVTMDADLDTLCIAALLEGEILGELELRDLGERQLPRMTPTRVYELLGPSESS